MMLDRDTIALAYRLFLDRAASPAEVDAMQHAATGESELRRIFLDSAEFARLQTTAPSAPSRHDSPLYHYWSRFDAEALLDRFAKSDLTPEPGRIVNFLGTRIEPKVWPQVLTGMMGHIDPRPDPGNWHADIAEWAAALYSVECARDRYCIVELGCGWGCWIVNIGVAARSRGLAVQLVGVEGDRGHLVNARDTLTLNGFEPKDYRLHHGVAGPRPGKAIFPDPAPGTAQWGGEPEFYPAAARLDEALRTPGVQVLDCIPLNQLGDKGPIDLLHIDIQGGEVDYVAGNAEAMAARVRRVLIGTHGRSIEGRLFDHFLGRGWRLEMDRPTIWEPQGTAPQGEPVIRIDGVQLWANPHL